MRARRGYCATACAASLLLASAGAASPCLAWKSLMAILTASSASIEQCSLTGGSFRCLAMSEFWILPHSSSVLPLSHSVAYDELAIAEPQPKVCAQERESRQCQD